MKRLLFKIKRNLKMRYKNIYRRLFRERLVAERLIKNALRIYYEGEYDYGDYGGDMTYIIEPIVKTTTLSQLGITNFKFKHKKDCIVFTIVLQRPGLLIGKGGKNFDAVVEHLNEWTKKKVLLRIEESKLW